MRRRQRVKNKFDTTECKCWYLTTIQQNLNTCSVNIFTHLRTYRNHLSRRVVRRRSAVSRREGSIVSNFNTNKINITSQSATFLFQWLYLLAAPLQNRGRGYTCLCLFENLPWHLNQIVPSSTQK